MVSILPQGKASIIASLPLQGRKEEKKTV